MDATELNREETYNSNLASSTWTGAGSRPTRGVGRLIQLLPVLGMFGIVLGGWLYRPVDSFLFYGVGFGITFLSVFLGSQTQRKARRGEDVSSYVPITTWLAFVPPMLAAVMLVNGAMDRQPVDAREQVVIQKYIQNVKGTSYHIKITSWRPGYESEDLPVKAQDYGGYQVHDHVVVDVHRGALHIPWIGGVRKVDTAVAQ